MNKTDLEALLARVEAATGPDKQLGLDIGIALGVFDANELGDGFARLVNGQNYTDLTSSIDAAVALCERVLPGIGRTVTNKPAPEAWIFGDCEEDGNNDHLIVDMISNAKAATEPLALLAAIIRAKIAEAKESV